MLKQYIGPHDEVRVVIAGNEIGIVKHGDSISVPDELAESVGWAETLWQDFKPPTPARPAAPIATAPATNSTTDDGEDA